MSKLQKPSEPVNGRDDAPFGSDQNVFDAVDELACMAGIHAEQIRLHAMTGDMAGVEYATRRLWAHMRALGGIIKDYKEHGQTLGRKGERL